jgi:DNA-binding GntR family transcriptional regulator
VLDRMPHPLARVHEQDDLLRAIADGDADSAREIIAEHVETFEREIRAVL